MKSIRSILAVYAALTLFAAPAALSDEVAVENKTVVPIDSLDSAIQHIGSGQAETLPPVAPSLSQSNGASAAQPAAQANATPALPAQENMQAAESSSAETTPMLWVYEFSAKWCPSCRKLSPIVEEAASKYNGFIKFVPINVDKNEALVRKLNIAQIPTVMVVDRRGRTLNRLIGLQQGVQLDEILNHYKAESMASVGSGTH